MPEPLAIILGFLEDRKSPEGLRNKTFMKFIYFLKGRDPNNEIFFFVYFALILK